MPQTEDPFTGPPPKEIPLQNAPLARVLVQVRFPEILAVERREFVAPFQEAIRAAYPVLREEQVQVLVAGHSGVAQARPGIAWRFSDTAGDWRASLTSGFLALETTRYSSRSDLLARLTALLSAVDTHLEPKLIDRIGVRYVDRIVGEAVGDIAELVRAEVRGVAGEPVAAHAVHSLTETLFELGDDRIFARWGHLPPGVTIDPSAIEAVPEKSWILDLDMFSTNAIPFAAQDVVRHVERYAERIYSVFRWVVEDEFLRRYGGQL